MSKQDDNEVTWKHHAIGFGVFIYLINIFIIPYFSDLEISLESILFGIPISVGAGYAFGRFKKWQIEKK